MGAAGAQHLDDEFLGEVLPTNSDSESRAARGFLAQYEAFALMVGNERRVLSEEEDRTVEKGSPGPRYFVRACWKRERRARIAGRVRAFCPNKLVF